MMENGRYHQYIGNNVSCHMASLPKNTNLHTHCNENLRSEHSLIHKHFYFKNNDPCIYNHFQCRKQLKLCKMNSSVLEAEVGICFMFVLNIFKNIQIIFTSYSIIYILYGLTETEFVVKVSIVFYTSLYCKFHHILYSWSVLHIDKLKVRPVQSKVKLSP
jgi:hypothetical protein